MDSPATGACGRTADGGAAAGPLSFTSDDVDAAPAARNTSFGAIDVPHRRPRPPGQRLSHHGSFGKISVSERAVVLGSVRRVCGAGGSSAALLSSRCARGSVAWWAGERRRSRLLRSVRPGLCVKPISSRSTRHETWLVSTNVNATACRSSSRILADKPQSLSAIGRSADARILDPNGRADCRRPGPGSPSHPG